MGGRGGGSAGGGVKPTVRANGTKREPIAWVPDGHRDQGSAAGRGRSPGTSARATAAHPGRDRRSRLDRRLGADRAPRFRVPPAPHEPAPGPALLLAPPLVPPGGRARRRPRAPVEPVRDGRHAVRGRHAVGLAVPADDGAVVAARVRRGGGGGGGGPPPPPPAPARGG